MATAIKRNLFIVLFVLVLIPVAWFVLQSKPIEVTLSAVSQGVIEETVANTRAGTVTACRRAKLAPHIGGQIAKLHATEGQLVKKNEILVEIWNQDKKAQYELAKNEAVAALAKSKEACVRYQAAKREAKRQQRLLEQGLTSSENADQVQSDADANHLACQAAEGLVDVAASQVKVVEAELERTLVRAPFDGIIAEVNGEIGEFVTPSPVGVATLPVVDLIDNQCIYVTAPIDEVDAALVKVGLPARIVLDAFPKHPFDALVKKISPYVQDYEKQARTVNVDVHFNRSIGELPLLPGYSADTEIIIQSKPNVLRVPSDAIVESNYVYLYHSDDATVSKHPIKKGISNWNYTEVLEGLTIDSRIVSSVGVEGLADGVKVRVTENK